MDYIKLETSRKKKLQIILLNINKQFMIVYGCVFRVKKIFATFIYFLPAKPIYFLLILDILIEIIYWPKYQEKKFFFNRNFSRF
jgi:hypothetical protein